MVIDIRYKYQLPFAMNVNVYDSGGERVKFLYAYNTRTKEALMNTRYAGDLETIYLPNSYAMYYNKRIIDLVDYIKIYYE